MIDVDPRSPVPLYLQMVEQVRRLVALGALRPGDRLPTVRELAARARVNRNTAARAIQALEAEGLLRTRVGQGTFVADGAGQGRVVERQSAVDAALDRVVVEAASLGVNLDTLPERLVRHIEDFRTERKRAGTRRAPAFRRAAASSSDPGGKEESS
jgi:GntR family transcriptional regulator